uniref:Uncharacterized protein n=1 Tax=Cannabis sativa TaxID=3483 RepID=A0A803P448_CANSA
MTTFLVVDRSLAYNVVLGRPSLFRLKAIILIYHLTIKFPTCGGVVTLKGDQDEARECYSMSLRIATRPPERTIVVTHGGPCQSDKISSKLDPRICEEVRMEFVEELDETVISESLPKGNKQFSWGKDCEKDFASVKEHLGNPPLLAKLEKGKKLYIYLAISEHALTAALPYFHANLIVVLTNHPLRQVVHKPETLRFLLKWSIELSQFDISYTLRVSINKQVIADFVVEFTYPVDGEDQWQEVGEESKSEAKDKSIRELHVDGA